MFIRVKYNNDTRFRRRAAFYRMYRAKDFKKRFRMEMALLGICALTSAILWISGSDARTFIYVFFVSTAIAVWLIIRLLRSLMIAARVRPSDESRAEREFQFHEKGFSFGPIDEAGKLLETRWRDFDKVYFTREAIYILCMVRRHWAVVDKSLIVEGTAEELEQLIRSNIPKRLTAG